MLVSLFFDQVMNYQCVWVKIAKAKKTKRQCCLDFQVVMGFSWPFYPVLSITDFVDNMLKLFIFLYFSINRVNYYQFPII